MTAIVGVPDGNKRNNEQDYQRIIQETLCVQHNVLKRIDRLYELMQCTPVPYKEYSGDFDSCIQQLTDSIAFLEKCE